MILASIGLFGGVIQEGGSGAIVGCRVVYSSYKGMVASLGDQKENATGRTHSLASWRCMLSVGTRPAEWTDSEDGPWIMFARHNAHLAAGLCLPGDNTSLDES